ncbi:MAG: DEAD/DEAH box helicase family protein, partial [Rickettsiales bacterium]|nr:DEAD/DEAH box helicase family protein [Rickettsiales bacterium]
MSEGMGIIGGGGGRSAASEETAGGYRQLTFDELLDKYREDLQKRELGTLFEIIMQRFLKTYALYKDRFTDVFLWNDWEHKKLFSNGQDIGIDLVAQEENGALWAIQCKCYEKGHRISKGDIDSFISISAKEVDGIKFKYRLFISSTNEWSENAKITCEDQNPQIYKISLSDLQTAKVDWNKIEKGKFGTEAQILKKSLKEHQKEAIDKYNEYFKNIETEKNKLQTAPDRGKLIMACGTGKTFTSLKIMEEQIRRIKENDDRNGFILFLVPSISLVRQTLKEWSEQSNIPIRPICICSDNTVGKIRKNDINNEDEVDLSLTDFEIPVSTNERELCEEILLTYKKIPIKETLLKEIDKQEQEQKQKEQIEKNKNRTIVIFSTYHSLETVHKAQHELQKEYPKHSNRYIFDIVFCDEAHRTARLDEKDREQSFFTKIHDNNYIKANKRIYMTATPKVYGENATKKLDEDSILYSMDNEKYYGKEFYKYSFSKAIRDEQLSDYKVIILTLDENEHIFKKVREDYDIIYPQIQNRNFKFDDIIKIIGAIKGILKLFNKKDKIPQDIDLNPLKKTIAYCRSIENSKNIVKHLKQFYEKYKDSIDKSQEKYQQMLDILETISIEMKHIDGSMSAEDRDKQVDWLKNTNDNECKILSNVRCLSEGIDVPALDGIIFLSPRGSQVDCVQSVGRVMRKAEGKKYGYVILPVVIPMGSNIDKELDKGKDSAFKVVWEVLCSLRSHDDSFQIMIEHLQLREKSSPLGNLGKEGKFIISGPDYDDDDEGETDKKMINSITSSELYKKICPKIVEKVGDKLYWSHWVSNIGEITLKYQKHIEETLQNNEEFRIRFDEFFKLIQTDINNQTSKLDIIEMLGQYFISKPIFDVLFSDLECIKDNSFSKKLNSIIEILNEKIKKDDFDKMDKFVEDIKEEVKGINNDNIAKQNLIRKIYDEFFSKVNNKKSEKYGIVYTPVEVIDFMLHSADYISKKEFGAGLGDENAKILEPFCGAGSFIVRLLQSDLIDIKNLQYKYQKEIFACEILLLAYYIANINIELAYHSKVDEYKNDLFKKHQIENCSLNYKPFENICLTDTFNAFCENNDAQTQTFSFIEKFENTKRIEKIRNLDLKVIIGNPPYNMAQKNANDDNKRTTYNNLHKRIAETYCKNTNVQAKNGLYNDYFKAFRMSTDKIGDSGIVSFITPNGWIDSKNEAFRKTIKSEFSDIYVIDLKGNLDIMGKKDNKREGGNIFGIKTGVAITILVKNKNKINETGIANIYYYNIGDFIKSGQEKLNKLANLKSVENIKDWQNIIPNAKDD